MKFTDVQKPASPVPTVENFRTLDNVVCGGRKVRKGKFLRCASLDTITDGDLEALVTRWGPAFVFDFRTEYEINRAPDRPVPGAEYVNIPLINTNGNLYKNLYPAPGDTVSPQEKLSRFICSPVSRMLADGFYVSFVADDECQEGYARFFRTIIDAGCPAVLWHCSQGKDRTGLAAAFMLYALGADRRTVVDEYLLSDVFYKPEADYVKKVVASYGGLDEEMAIVQGLFSVNLDWFDEALDYIDNFYGSMDSYLRNQLKLSEKDINVLRGSYLD